MNTKKTFRKVLAMALSVSLVLGMVPMTAFAEQDSSGLGASGEIIAFEALPDQVTVQTVPLGTSLEDLDLPGTLTATVQFASEAETATPTNSAESGATDLDEAEQDDFIPSENEEIVEDSEPDDFVPSEDEEIATASNAAKANEAFSELTIPVPVTWTAEPDYDGDTEGTYTFTAEAEGFTVSTAPPTITVTVGTAAGSITAFAKLPEETRWQSVEFGTALGELNLPETLAATVEGNTAQVSVTWESDPAYDAQQKGLYLFTARLADGFSTTAELPVIAVVVRAGQSSIAPYGFGGGAQESDPFLIGSAAQLAEIAAMTNAGQLEVKFLGTGVSGKVYLKLDNDIDLSGYASANSGTGWMPIGNSTMSFFGSLDGGGHIITGLTINRPSGSYQGLFGYINGGTVKNLGVVGVDITGFSSVGGVAGDVSNGTVTNCYSNGTVTGSMAAVGGVAGTVNNSTVASCYSTGSVSGTDNSTGGVVGYVRNLSTVENCYSTGMVSSNDMVGGVAGSVDSSSTVINCAALNPSVSGNSDVGRVTGYTDSTLTDNLSFGGMGLLEGGSPKTPIDDANGPDGASTTAAALIGDTGGILSGRFTAANGWDYIPGGLPILKNMAGQDAAMPAHIVDGGNSAFFPGAGTAGNPYQIATAEQLAKLAELVNAGDAAYSLDTVHYKLTANIDLSGYQGGEGWTPIGKSGGTFKGSFDGGGHIISGLTINRPTENNQGLFGYIGGGSVKNLGVVGVNIIGDDYIGGIIGYVVNGSVTNCYSTGTVSGADYVGGIVGVNGNSTLSNCYITGTVSGTDCVGGVAGYFSIGTVKNCAALNLSVTASGNVGRVVGFFDGSGILSNNYAYSGMTDPGTSKFGTSTGLTDENGASKTAAEINTIHTGAGGDADLAALFAGPEWTTAAGYLPGLGGKLVEMPQHLWPAGTVPFEGSGNTEADPYLIKSPGDLARLAALTSGGNTFSGKFFLLENNLDLSGYASGEGWTPIGNSVTPFQGSFDGSGHSITGLTINRPTDDEQGLFGVIRNGRVKNLGIVGAKIRGKDYIGGIAGYVGNSSAVTNCYSTGIIRGNNYVGGMAGDVVGGTVTNCYSAGAVTGTGFFVGGVAGDVIGTVTNCYSTGTVSGNSCVGGVAGSVYGTVKGCAALNPGVTGSSNVGRVSGDNPNNRLSYNYAYSGTKVNNSKVTGGTHMNINGADATSATLFGGDFWTGSVLDWNTNTWDFADGKLPILKDTNGSIMPDQSGAPDAYLLNFSTDDLTVALSGAGVSGSGTSFTANTDYAAQTVTVAVTGWENWTDPEINVTWKQGTGTPASITMTSGSGTFQIPAEYSGTITVTAASVSNPGNNTIVTLTVNKRTLSAADFSGFTIPVGRVYNGSPQGIDTVPVPGGTANMIVHYNGSPTVPTNAGTYAVTLHYSGDGVYNETGPSGWIFLGSYTIAKAPAPSISWPTSTTILYGTALSTSVLNGGSTQYGTFAWTSPAIIPTVANGGYSVTFTPYTNTVDNYDPITTTTQTVSIAVAPKNVSLLTIDPIAPVTYDGSIHTPAVTVKDGGTTLTPSTDYTVNYTNNTAAGMATVTVTGAGNYSGTKQATFTIQKATPAALTWPTAAGITYGAALSTSALSGGSTTGTWAWTTGTTIPPAGTNSYEVTFTPTDTSNYNWSGVTLRQNVSVAVAKASGLVPTVPPSMNAKATGALRSYSFNMNNIPLNHADTGAKTYSAMVGTDTSGIVSNVQVTGNNLTYDIAATAAVGDTATILIHIASGNYVTVTQTMTITVTAKDTQTIAFDDPTVDKTYGDADFKITAAVQGTGGSGAITYASDNTAVATVNAASGEVTIVGAGSANITATKAADSDWFAATAIYGLTVNKKTVMVKAEDKTIKQGEPLPTATVRYSGFVGTDSESNALATQAAARLNVSNSNTAGTSTIDIQTNAALNGTNGTNYSLDHKNGTLTIMPLSAACEVVALTSPSGMVNGTNIHASVANTVSSQSIIVTVSPDATWKLYSDTTCITEIADQTMTLSVGTNTAYLKVTAEDGITTQIYTVIITRSGSGGSSGNSGGNSSDLASGWAAATSTTTTTATQTLTSNPYKDGMLSINITEKMIEDGIVAAKTKWTGRESYGISISFHNTADGAKSLMTSIEASALDHLVSQGVKSLTIWCGIYRMKLDENAIKSLDTQSTGNVTVTVTPYKVSGTAAADISDRPVFEITFKDANGKEISDFGSGIITRGIKYTTALDELSGNLFVVRVVDQSSQWIDKSSYDNGWMIWSDNTCSVYGIGYKTDISFTDTQGHWAKDNIDFVVSRGFVTGNTATTFAPNTAITRADFLMALGKMSGVDISDCKQSSFTDVANDNAAMPYIEWAYNNDIVSGTGNNQFSPNATITREQIAVMMQNYAKIAEYSLPVSCQYNAYIDDHEINSWAKDAVKVNVQAGIIIGKDDNRFDPQGNTTRAEASIILCRFVKLVIDEGTTRGWVKNDSGSWMYFDWQGRRTTGWFSVTDTDIKYYFDTNGIMVSGKWLQIGGKWYYFYTDGKMARNTNVEGYTVGEDGIYLTD